jgi:hypothetical protein
MTHCATAPSKGLTPGRGPARLASPRSVIRLITVSQIEETSNANDPTPGWRSGPS